MRSRSGGFAAVSCSLPNPGLDLTYNTMRPLQFLADAFINTFGITQPTPEARSRAERFIGALLAAVVIGIGAIGYALHLYFRH